MTENTSDEYSKFEQIKVCGDTAADILRCYDGIPPTTSGLIHALLLEETDKLEIYPGYVRYWGGIEGTRAVDYDEDIDLALADLLTWELYLGEK